MTGLLLPLCLWSSVLSFRSSCCSCPGTIEGPGGFHAPGLGPRASKSEQRAALDGCVTPAQANGHVMCAAARYTQLILSQ